MEKALLLVLPVIGVMLLGYLAVRFKYVADGVTDNLASFVLAVALPIFVFRTLARAKLSGNLGDVWQLLGSYYLAAVAVFVLAMVVARIAFQSGSSEQENFGAQSACSNTLLLGVPAVFVILGAKQSVPLAIVVGLHGMIMGLLVTLVVRLFRGRTTGLPDALWEEAARQSKKPMFIALVAGILYGEFGPTMHHAVDSILKIPAGAAVPCALFALGGMLTRYRPRVPAVEDFLAMILKMAVFPVIVWILAKPVFGLPGPWTWVVVMLATMPIAFDSHGLLKASAHGGEAEIATARLSTVLAAFGLVVLTYIITSG